MSLIDQRRRRPLSLFAIIGLFVASVALLCTSITTVASSALSRARMAHDRNGAELDAAPSIGPALIGSRGGPDRLISRTDIYAGGLGVSAMAMIGREVDRRAQIVVAAGWPDVGRV